jgi:hypothetical protein
MHTLAAKALLHLVFKACFSVGQRFGSVYCTHADYALILAAAYFTRSSSCVATNGSV